LSHDCYERPNDGDSLTLLMHERMKGRGQNKRESTMNYVFEMNAMGKNGGMAETTIVQYIIRGLCSADLREVVVASCPTALENLMQKVRIPYSVYYSPF
jgi:hypothetical protein